MTDPYLIPGTETLRNKLGITDPDRLEAAVHDIAESSALKLFASGRAIPATMAGWQAVHRAMFGQIFDWAGQFRTIHIRKAPQGQRREAFFTPFERIASEGAKAVKNLAVTLRHVQGRNIEAIAENLADDYGEMNDVHPFREGNGRSQKAFFSLVCGPQGLELRWHRIAPLAHTEAARRSCESISGASCPRSRTFKSLSTCRHGLPAGNRSRHPMDASASADASRAAAFGCESSCSRPDVERNPYNSGHGAPA